MEGQVAEAPVRFRVSRPHLSDSEIGELHMVFNLFSVEGTDLLDVSELKEAMESLGFKENDEEIYRMIAELEAKQQGRAVKFDEFLEGLIPSNRNLETKEEVDEIFKLYTKENVIAEEDIRRAAKELDEEFSEDEVKKIMKTVACNGGKITKDDFYNVVTSKMFQ
eukprot:TRINITY_DN15332_c0_g2_i2.p1 TRINITY_DN15332_c0_g2~~TRINITY_DN15332_c0_g2_i2.p1  ORF type:complete len:165 (-),score=41.23 TRINITY_DN15332_c0_g2_i2:73-567(-)